LKPPEANEKPNDRNLRLIARSKVPKMPYEIKKNDIRPLYHKQTPHGSVLSRSPMISMIFPSMKDKIRQFKQPINMEIPPISARLKSAAGTARLSLNMGTIMEKDNM
jgi:hypothetical protein